MQQPTTELNELTFTLPDLSSVTVRRQNGDDDEILSRYGDILTGKATNNFLAGIITTPRVTTDEIAKWKNNNRSYVILKSRIFSLGPILDFYHTCSNPKCEKTSNFTEDLLKYDTDFTQKQPEIGSKDYFIYKATPYALGKANEVEFKLTSGRKIKYNILSGADDDKTLDSNMDNYNKNSELLSRKISYYEDDKNEWVPIVSFKAFDAKDMREIRTSVEKNDKKFMVITSTLCPYCGKKDDINLLTLVDFFYPLEILKTTTPT